MIQYTIERVSQIIAAGNRLYDKAAVIEALSTDSRRLISASSALFFALHGPRRDGHAFIPEAYRRGVRNFVVNTDFNIAEYPEGNFLFVADVLTALQQLAAFHRSQFNIPVIGITGSNGKTIVKEWLNVLLEKEYHIVRSPKSYNSQIGVPVSIWQIEEADTLGIFEAGISQPGEMNALQKIIRPEMGILTHIGDAHGENFRSAEEKIAEKLQLFRDTKWMVANGDDPLVVQKINEVKLNAVFWGQAEHCAIRITSLQKSSHHTIATITTAQKPAIPHLTNSRPFSIEIPFIDDASVENTITCCAALLCMGYPAEKIKERIHLLRPVNMRLEMKQGINNCSLINDTYIADLSSLYIALDFLEQQKQHDRRTVILSDFLETGVAPGKLYQEIAIALQQKKITRCIGIGEKINEHRQFFEAACKEASFYSSTEDYIAGFHSNAYRDETILVKGARSFSFERIIGLLEQKAHQTVLEISLSAITHNLKKYQELLSPSVKIMAMVKAFSYGSGSFEVANILQFHKVDYLAVAYTDEGVELRKAGITLPIMVMNPEIDSFAALTEHYLEPELFSFYILKKFREHLSEQGLKHYPVHIKIDTGMHRLGFDPGACNELISILAGDSLLRVQSVFSHLSGSEDPLLDDFTQQQTGQYLAVCKAIEPALSYPFLKHIANSAAIIRHRHLHFDMVRLGIGLYGVDSTGENALGLKEAATLKTTIAQIKDIKAGETVGYGRKGKIRRDSRIATIRIGYADGYRRSFSNGNGYVLIRGQKANVTGNIAMDMTMVDITDIPGVTEEDEAVIFGEALPVSTLAQWADTIPYEIMTGISQRVLRVYYEE
ncbi:MAG: bifunctional UDP-N-acetylmuramoyl-tripeptide:D-alanyl-D-alanine ligase/alanine racemase [Sphingobacteriales bacterium]|nr:bifunctional UDP-N-acetylmuramoyl-tripeptide:D-alanyl-D-alanine ligase/alanine racemase [Sphingobacteriales bacterium]